MASCNEDLKRESSDGLVCILIFCWVLLYDRVSVVLLPLGLVCPGSSVVEHLHGKQAVVGSIPISGRCI